MQLPWMAAPSGRQIVRGTRSVVPHGTSHPPTSALPIVRILRRRAAASIQACEWPRIFRELGRRGRVSTETLRAFTDDEYKKIIFEIGQLFLSRASIARMCSCGSPVALGATRSIHAVKIRRLGFFIALPFQAVNLGGIRLRQCFGFPGGLAPTRFVRCLPRSGESRAGYVLLQHAAAPQRRL